MRRRIEHLVELWIRRSLSARRRFWNRVFARRLSSDQPAKSERALRAPCPVFHPLAYFLSIGGPIFSAGAGGNAAFAPCRWASGAGRAGSGAGLVGRVPPGFDSAGLLSFCETTAPCGGTLGALAFCCAPCAAAIKAPDTTITVATINRAGPKSILPLRLCWSRCMAFDRVKRWSDQHPFRVNVPRRRVEGELHHSCARCARKRLLPLLAIGGIALGLMMQR